MSPQFEQQLKEIFGGEITGSYAPGYDAPKRVSKKNRKKERIERPDRRLASTV